MSDDAARRWATLVETMLATGEATYGAGEGARRAFGATSLKTSVDVWGPPGEAQPLLKRVKDTLDPNHVLNAGRGVI